MKVDNFLSTAIFGGDLLKTLDADNLDSPDLADPFRQFQERVALEQFSKRSSLVDASWDAPLTSANRVEKSAPAEVTRFSKNDPDFISALEGIRRRAAE